MSSGLRENFGTMTKAFHAGHAARSGVESAVLASLGFTASRNILERELGFCNLFTDKNGYDLEKITKDLGSPFSIISPGVGKKLYPSCAATHSVLDGVFHLIKEFNIKSKDVDSVECGIFYLYPKMLIHSSPQTGLEGKFSLEFCVALAFAERAVRLTHFVDSTVQDPQIQGLIKRVKKCVTTEVGGKGTQYPGATIRVNLKNGESYSYKVEKRKGSPADPLVTDEIVQKFMDCACLIHSRKQASRIVDAAMGIENSHDISQLIRLITKS
jgi:2-methylcitrate dehydratase PrpD